MVSHLVIRLSINGYGCSNLHRLFFSGVRPEDDSSNESNGRLLFGISVSDVSDTSVHGGFTTHCTYGFR